MNELVRLNGTQLRTIDPAGLARIEQGMIEQRRISAIFGRSNTQTSIKLMSLTMLSAGVYRRLRQCAAEIEKRKLALQENGIRLRRAKLKAAQWQERANDRQGIERELALLKAEEYELQISASLTYVEGALKDIAALQDAYAQIKASSGVRDGWDEKDAEEGEVEHHFRSVFTLAYRESIQWGHMTAAGCEYAEQFGMHPQSVQHEVDLYIAANRALLAEGKAPHAAHMHAWLDAMAKHYRPCLDEAIKAVGLTELITRWSLYVEPG